MRGKEVFSPKLATTARAFKFSKLDDEHAVEVKIGAVGVDCIKWSAPFTFQRAPAPPPSGALIGVPHGLEANTSNPTEGAAFVLGWTVVNTGGTAGSFKAILERDRTLSGVAETKEFPGSVPARGSVTQIHEYPMGLPAGPMSTTRSYHWTLIIEFNGNKQPVAVLGLDVHPKPKPSAGAGAAAVADGLAPMIRLLIDGSKVIVEASDAETSVANISALYDDVTLFSYAKPLDRSLMVKPTLTVIAEDSKGNRISIAPMLGHEPQVVLSSPIAARGGTVGVSWARVLRPRPQDWVGLFTPGAPNDSSVLAWGWAGGTADGQVMLSIPPDAPEGSYEARFFSGVGQSELLSRSAEWVVVGSGDPPRPIISALSPSSGPVISTTLTIEGLHFGNDPAAGAVWIGGTQAVPATWTNTRIVANVHQGATTGNVVVCVGSACSNGVSFVVTQACNSTLCDVPAAPTDVKAVAGDGQVMLSWTPVSGAVQYIVKSSLHQGGPYFAGVVGASNPFVQAGLTQRTTYYFVISALNAAGEGTNSAEVAATPNFSLDLAGSPPELNTLWSRNESGAVTPIAAKGRIR